MDRQIGAVQELQSEGLHEWVWSQLGCGFVPIGEESVVGLGPLLLLHLQRRTEDLTVFIDALFAGLVEWTEDSLIEVESVLDQGGRHPELELGVEGVIATGGHHWFVRPIDHPADHGLLFFGAQGHHVDVGERRTQSVNGAVESRGVLGHSDSNSGIGQLIHHGCPSAEKQHLLFDEICLGDRCRALHRRCRRPPNHPSRSPILLFGNFCLWGLR